MTCKNCGHIFEGNFCNNCGQSSKVGRINLKNFLAEVSESVFQINRGFFYTLKELFLRPGYSIQEYLSGKRKSHFKPFGYVLILSTIYFLTTQFTDQSTWLDDIISGFLEGAEGGVFMEEAPPALAWFSKNFAYATLLLLPIFSLASYLSFFKSKTNYLEHIVLNSYITGQQTIFYLLLGSINMYLDYYILGALPVLVSISYAFWVFWQFFNKGKRILNILGSILTYVLYLIFSTGLLLIVLAI